MSETHAYLSSLADAIHGQRERALLSKRALQPQYVPRASGIDRCGRQMQLSILHWDKKQEFDAWTLALFGRGNEIEQWDKIQLMQAGFEVVGGQYALQIKDRAGKRVICSGHLDGRIRWHGRDVVFDVKSMDPQLWKRVPEGFDGVAHLMRGKWTEKYLWQLLLYMYEHDEQCGIFLIDDCRAHWKLVLVVLDDHLDRCEEALTRCESVVDAIEADELLPYHDDAAHCRDCWCYKRGVCSPPMDFKGQGIQLIESAIDEEDLEKMEALAMEGREYVRAERRVRERMKARGPGDYLFGNFRVTVSKTAVGLKVRSEKIKDGE